LLLDDHWRKIRKNKGFIYIYKRKIFNVGVKVIRCILS